MTTSRFLLQILYLGLAIQFENGGFKAIIRSLKGGRKRIAIELLPERPPRAADRCLAVAVGKNRVPALAAQSHSVLACDGCPHSAFGPK
jgi:hypothetical protein